MLGRVRPPPLPHQLDLLTTVLSTVEAWEGQRSPAVVFDLDATLFDNRARTLEILVEYREMIASSDPELADALAEIDGAEIEYLLTDTLKGCGIYKGDDVKAISSFWRERFFTDEYIACDVPLAPV